MVDPKAAVIERYRAIVQVEVSQVGAELADLTRRLCNALAL